MAKKPAHKQALKLDSAHNIHSVLDFMLAETVLGKQHCSKRFSLPYNLVMQKPDPDYADALLVIEIYTYWDVKRSENERDDEPRGANPIKTRH